MSTFFHFAPILLAPGSAIRPGNFGRIIKARGAAHFLYRREMAYEAYRLKHFGDRPSRLDCVFCFPTKTEAELYRAHIGGYADSILYEVKSDTKDPHVADANNGVQHYSLPIFDESIMAYYWQGRLQPPNPNATVLREVLLRDSIIILDTL